MDRHHGKELLDRPTVGHRLEQREVAEVGVGQQRVEPFQLFGHELELFGQPLDLATDGPEQVFGRAPLVERKVARREQRHGHVHRLLRVVKALEHVAGGEVLIGIDQVVQRLLGIGRYVDQVLVAIPLARDAKCPEN